MNPRTSGHERNTGRAQAIVEQDTARRGNTGRRPWALVVLCLLICLGCGAEPEPYPPRPHGNLWHVPTPDGARLVFLLQTSHRESKLGIFDRHIVTRCRLHGYDLPAGKAVVPVVIAQGEENEESRQILGNAYGQLWLWNGGLEARDPSSFAVIHAPADIRRANPALADELPVEIRYVGMSGVLGAPVIQALDGTFYRIDGAGVAHPLDPNDRGRLEEEMGRVVGRKLLVHGSADEAGFATMSDLTANRIRIGETELEILTDHEAENARNHVFEFRSSRNDEPARIFVTNLEDGAPQHETIRPLGSPAQLQPAFLRDSRQRFASWDGSTAACILDDPPSFLVLSKENLAREAAWLVSRIDQTGHMLWQADTGIADLDRVLTTDRALVFGGCADFSEPTRVRRYDLRVVDLRDGSAVTLRLPEE